MGAGKSLTRLLVVAAGAIGLVPSCKSDMSAPDAGEDLAGADVDFVSCAAETRAPPFQQGMQVTSSGSGYLIKLLRNTFTDPLGKVLTEAPAKGVDVWTIEADSTTTLAPIDGLSLSVKPWMPDHGHGTTSVGVMPAGSGGIYTISPLNLYMAGYWEVTINLVDRSSETPVTDSALLKICVPD